jgi:hypothetical protein
MLVTIHYQDKNKTINACDFSHLKEQIALNFYLNYLKQGYKKSEAYEMTAKEIGLSADRIRKIILTYANS